jgi:hypothetical protein
MMHYLLVFLGLIGVAVILTVSPLIVRFLDSLASIVENERAPANVAAPQSIERAEMRDEIRRLTAALETDRRGARKS